MNEIYQFILFHDMVVEPQQEQDDIQHLTTFTSSNDSHKQ